MRKANKQTIYLDNHATTRCDPRVIEAMLPFFSEEFGNPSSTIHSMGRAAQLAVEEARSQVAQLIGAYAKEIVFTSGATESNNLAILGLARASGDSRKKVITSAIEHKSVLNACNQLKAEGFSVVELPVDTLGRVDLDATAKEIDENTLLVSIQAASNEIGTIQPVRELSALARKFGAFMHCDAAQAVGKIPVDVVDFDVDFLSFSGHKMYGPKGTGGLYLRGGPYAFPLAPLLQGGGQEYGLRSGTYNVPAIVGMGVAADLSLTDLPEESTRIAGLRDRFEHLILQRADARLNGDPENRLPGNCSLTIENIDAEVLITSTSEVIFSTGSACNSGSPEPSNVLQAIGLTREEAYNTIRICFGRFNEDGDPEQAAQLLVNAIEESLKLNV